MDNTQDINSTLSGHLKELRLRVMRECYADIGMEALQESLSYEEYLLILAERECTSRRAKRIDRNLGESKIPLDKNIDSFDLKRLPGKVSHQVKTLLDGRFLDYNENVLVFGNPGSGKTHLLCAIGQELIRNGKRAYFSTCSLLVQELLRAKQEFQLPRQIKKLSRYDALIIDDIGYVQQDRSEMAVLFTLLAERYERGSVMLSSNLPFSKWEQIFKDPMVTAAAVDRLVHHSVILELNIPSYRMAEAKSRKKHNAKEKEVTCN